MAEVQQWMKDAAAKIFDRAEAFYSYDESDTFGETIIRSIIASHAPAGGETDYSGGFNENMIRRRDLPQDVFGILHDLCYHHSNRDIADYVRRAQEALKERSDGEPNLVTVARKTTHEIERFLSVSDKPLTEEERDSSKARLLSHVKKLRRSLDYYEGHAAHVRELVEAARMIVPAFIVTGESGYSRLLALKNALAHFPAPESQEDK